MTGLPISATTLGTPLRHLAVTLVLTTLALALAGITWQSTGYEMLIVAMGWPHVILGFVFFFRKVLRNNRVARAQFALLSLATALLWALHHAFDLTALIFFYFLYHAFRDEVSVYLSLQARYRTPVNPYLVTGILPLIFFLLLFAEPQDFRQDLRRVELSGAQIRADDWTLFRFRPVQDSSGREFYFHLVAPGSPEEPRFLSEGEGTTAQTAIMRVDDRRWHEGVSLSFAPDYHGQTATLPPDRADSWRVLLTGGQRVGQVFTATQDGLSGIWLRTHRPAAFDGARTFVLHLASPPLLPLEAHWNTVRWVLQGSLLAILLWCVARGVRGSSAGRQLWFYLAVFSVIFVLLQQWLKDQSRSGSAVPMIFQFVVVFHYFRWYVLSFHKLHIFAADGMDVVRADPLRHERGFAMAVVGLNLVSFVLVCWYYLWNGPQPLRYGLDYSWFLYVLVFHVTFSFSPKLGALSGRSASLPPSPSSY